jgi:uncharacterized protein (TIGR02996 family)
MATRLTPIDREERAFLRAIITAPGDDLPRLIYADYLDERGDSRGEFIRLQVALSRPDVLLSVRDVRDLRARERLLLYRHRSAWLGRLDCEWRGDAVFERGFVVQVDVSARQFIRHAQAWLRREPIRRAALYGSVTCMRELALCPALKHFTALSLRNNELRREHVRQLLRSPYLTRLLELDLSYNHLGPASGALVTNAPTLPSLEVFHFDGNYNLYDVDHETLELVRAT